MRTVRTNGKEYFYSISGLGVPKNVVNSSLVQDLEFIVDWVPKIVDSLQYLLEYHIDAFIAQLKTLHEILNAIYARWLVNDAAKLIKVAEMHEIEMCRKMLPQFIAKAHTLSIDIQMEQKSKDVPKKTENHYDKTEPLRDVLNSLKIVSELLEKPDNELDFDRIMSITASISDLKGGEFTPLLFSSIASRNKETSKIMVNKIAAVYTNKINVMNDSATVSSKMKKILIVDDMPETLSALVMMLEGHYQVFPISDGAGALNFIDSVQTPDAFILDIEMPVMDGLALAKRIRLREKHKETPILFLTGNSSRDVVVRAYQINASAFIVKPANKEVIISKLSGCLHPGSGQP